MNILVTGGAGYIGSATAEALLQAGHSVTVYDSLVTGHRAAVPAAATFVEAALEQRAVLSRVLTRGGFDAVMHFAAFIEAGESMKEPGRFYTNNLGNSLSLIETAALAGVQKFVLSSTAAVYRSSDEPLTEDAPLGPTNVYGHTKLVVEQALDWYRRAAEWHTEPVIKAIYETISRDEARHGGAYLQYMKRAIVQFGDSARSAFAKIGVLMASAKRTAKALHPTNLHVNRTLFPNDTVQSRLPEPGWLEHWLDQQIRFDADWESKVVERILHNLSLLFGRPFENAQSLNRYRKEIAAVAAPG